MKWLLTFDNFKKIIAVIGVKGLEEIRIRDNNLKILDKYKGFSNYPAGWEIDETVNYIKRNYLDKIGDNFYVEIVRK